METNFRNKRKWVRDDDFDRLRDPRLSRGPGEQTEKNLELITLLLLGECELDEVAKRSRSRRGRVLFFKNHVNKLKVIFKE
jgi:hypothetical protein